MFVKPPITPDVPDGSCDHYNTVRRWPMDSSVSGAGRAASYISSEWLKLILANAEQIGILSIVTALAVR